MPKDFNTCTCTLLLLEFSIFFFIFLCNVIPRSHTYLCPSSMTTRDQQITVLPVLQRGKLMALIFQQIIEKQNTYRLYAFKYEGQRVWHTLVSWICLLEVLVVPRSSFFKMGWKMKRVTECNILTVCFVCCNVFLGSYAPSSHLSISYPWYRCT